MTPFTELEEIEARRELRDLYDDLRSMNEIPPLPTPEGKARREQFRQATLREIERLERNLAG